MTFYKLIVLLVVCAGNFAFGQKPRVYDLASELKEISGLEILNDSTLVAINDGGNSATLFLLKNNGEIKKKVQVTNAENNDWEDITRDEDYIYIGDFGNNQNKRRDLKIYKIDINSVLKKDEVRAEIIAFNYAEQNEFPPSEANKLYDAEALAYYNDSLWIITKPNPKLWEGDAAIYTISTTPGNYELKRSGKIFIGPDSWLSDAVTAADFYQDELYLTTYNRVIRFKFAEKDFFQVDIWPYPNPSQMESVVVKSPRLLIMADEKNAILGGGNLYYLRTDVDQN